MNLPPISNSQIISHYQGLGVLTQGEGATELIAKIGDDAIHVLIDGNLRAKKGKQPALTLNHQGEMITNPREAYNRATRTMTRLMDTPDFITSIRSIQDGSFTEESGYSFGLPENIVPKIGDDVLFYGDGNIVRGLVIDGKEGFYRTKDEQNIKHKKWIRDDRKIQKMEFKQQVSQLDSDYESLPQEFRSRIDRFRSEDPNFRVESEAYEMFVCVQAMVLVPYFQSMKEEEMLIPNDNSLLIPEGFTHKINGFMKLSFDEQKELVPELYDGHSENTFGRACNLAYCYLEGQEL